MRALRDALRPGKDPHAQLRRLLAERHAADDVILFGSGTQALTAAILAARTVIDGQAPVALPGYTCYDVATAAIGADATLMLYDVDPDTLAPDWASLEAALQRGARVVVLAPHYGVAFDWTPADQLAERYGAVLVEDAAQGAGARWRGRTAGTFGKLSVLSFGRGKGWTGGGGGALLLRGGTKYSSKQPRRPRLARELTNLFAILAQWALARPSVYWLPYSVPWLHLGETNYHAPGPLEGMSRFSAALVLSTDALARRESEVRSAHAAELWDDLLEDLRIRSADPTAGSDEDTRPGSLRLPCRLPEAALEPGAMAALGGLGLEEGYPTTLAALEPVRARLVGDAPRLPGAERLARALVTLPTHGRTTPRDRRRIVSALNDLASSSMLAETSAVVLPHT